MSHLEKLRATLNGLNDKIDNATGGLKIEKQSQANIDQIKDDNNVNGQPKV